MPVGLPVRHTAPLAYPTTCLSMLRRLAVGCSVDGSGTAQSDGRGSGTGSSSGHPAEPSVMGDLLELKVWVSGALVDRGARRGYDRGLTGLDRVAMMRSGVDLAPNLLRFSPAGSLGEGKGGRSPRIAVGFFHPPGWVCWGASIGR